MLGYKTTHTLAKFRDRQCIRGPSRCHPGVKRKTLPTTGPPKLTVLEGTNCSSWSGCHRGRHACRSLTDSPASSACPVRRSSAAAAVISADRSSRPSVHPAGRPLLFHVPGFATFFDHSILWKRGFLRSRGGLRGSRFRSLLRRHCEPHLIGNVYDSCQVRERHDDEQRNPAPVHPLRALVVAQRVGIRSSNYTPLEFVV